MVGKYTNIQNNFNLGRNVVCISFIRDSGEQDDDFGYDDVRMSQQCMEFIQLTGYATQFKYQKV